MSPSDAITRLDAARAEVAWTPLANPAQEAARDALLKTIDDRTAICKQELQLRREFDANKKQIADLDQAIAHQTSIVEQQEALKRELSQKYTKRPLTLPNLSADDQKRFVEARAVRRAAATEVASLNAQRQNLANRQSQVRAAYRALRQSTAVGGLLPATPTDSVCVPCLEKLASDFGPKQRRQAAGQSVYPGKQNYGNCGIQSAGQLIKAGTGAVPDERDLLDEAVKDGNATDVFLGRLRRFLGEQNSESGGTNPKQRQDILTKYGVPSTIQTTTPANLATAIRQNKGIVVNVDAGLLWNDPQFAGGGHAIMVYDGDFDEAGKLTHVYVNDTGEDQQGRKMTINDFMNAANARLPHSSLNVTTNPIW